MTTVLTVVVVPDVTVPPTRVLLLLVIADILRSAFRTA